MNAYFKGQLLTGSRGPAGPDGNPVGTVISFMGTAAPKDYLVCDGAEYGVSEYPRLAALFREQFGAANYFGGDGETAFAVPDMRNLFLRGFHGGAEEQLSGEVGERQEATNHSGTYSAMTSGGKVGVRMLSMNTPATSYMADRTDTVVWAAVGSALDGTNQTVLAESDLRPLTYTSRPVNMAVLYCIKAVESDGGSSPGGVPKGTIVIWSGTAEDIPEGWALCDGQNGSPDLRDRFVLGSGIRPAGETGGEEKHQLTVDEMPTHHHTYTLYGKNSTYKVSASGTYSVSAYNSSMPSTGDAGKNIAHNNMPPYYTLCYIIKL